MIAADILLASDWPGFRGPNGSRIGDEKNLPVSRSRTKNLKWKTPLPGHSSSGPSVAGNRVFVTCYSG